VKRTAQAAREPKRSTWDGARPVTETLKVWLVQDILAPYRIKLFEKIARTPGIDFRLIMLSHGVRAKPEWVYEPEALPFPAEKIVGFSFYINYSKQLISARSF
jgi:hypothetical protein